MANLLFILDFIFIPMNLYLTIWNIKHNHFFSGVISSIAFGFALFASLNHIFGFIK